MTASNDSTDPHDFPVDVSIDDPTTLAIRNVVPQDDGFDATLSIPGHVHSEVEDYVETLHAEHFDSAEWVVESFAIDADEPDEVTLSFHGGRNPGDVHSFIDDLQSLARALFSDALEPETFDEWRVKHVNVDMDGINIRARFTEPAAEDADDLMGADHPAFERPPIVGVGEDPNWGGD